MGKRILPLLILMVAVTAAHGGENSLPPHPDEIDYPLQVIPLPSPEKSRSPLKNGIVT